MLTMLCVFRGQTEKLVNEYGGEWLRKTLPINLAVTHKCTCTHVHMPTHTCAAQRYTWKTNPHSCTHVATPICTTHIYMRSTYIPVYIQVHCILVPHTYTWKTHAHTHTPHLKKSQEIATPILSMGSHFSKSYLCIYLQGNSWLY